MNFKKLLGTGLLAGCGLANAAPVIDQNAPTANVLLAYSYQFDLAQSFRQTADNISGAGFYFYGGGGDGRMIVALYDQLPGRGVYELTSASAYGSHDSWVDVFWDPIAITPDTTYYLLLFADRDVVFAGDDNNGYARGQAYGNMGFGSFPTLDYTFRTFAESSFGTNPMHVPEPGTLMLLGVGLASLALLRRRRA